MSGPYQHIKHFADFRGVDLRSNDVLRAPGFASEGTVNVVHSPQGALTQRWGNHLIVATFGRYGVFEFKSTNILGTSVVELIGIGSEPSNPDPGRAKKLVRSSFTITNSNASPATVYHYYDEGAAEFLFRIDRGGTAIVSKGLGVGTEAVPYRLTALEAVVDGTSGLSMSTPSSLPAAFMELINGRVIAGSGGSVTIYYWDYSTIPQGVASHVDTTFSQDTLVGNEDFRSVSAVTLNNVLYLANPGTAAGEKRLLKYDGNRIFVAGFPSFSEAGAGLLTVGNLTSPQSVTDDAKGVRTITSSATIAHPNYKMRFVNIDKAGNRVEGVVADLGGSSSGPIQQIGDTSTHLQSNAYNRAFAKCAATSTSTTVTVTSGHKMQAGDVAYFWDSNQERFIQREVTATGATSLKLSTTSLDTDQTSLTYDTGATPRPLNGTLITNNARIAFYRTADAAAVDYYLIDEIPNWQVDSSLSAYQYYDTTDDSTALSREELTDDEFPHEPPPVNCGQVSVYNGGLILAGDYKRPNDWFFSDIDGPEYFPKVTHNYRMVERVMGHRQSGEFLVVGCASSLHVTSGVLAEFNFRVDQVGRNVGLQSHLSMQEIDEGVLVFSSNVGPMVLASGRDLQPLGGLEYPDGSKVSRILPFWTKAYASAAEKPVFARSVACVLPNDKLYLLFVPFEDPTKPTFATSSSVVWAFDYGRGAWWPWSGMNMAGGASVFDGTLYFGSRSHDGSSGNTSANVISHLIQQQRSVDVGVYTYADHDAFTPWTFRSHWESLGEPDLYKRFLRCRIRSNETRLAASTTMDLNTYIDESLSLQSTDDTLTWAGEKSLNVKIRAEDCLSLLVEFTQAARYQPNIITGYTLEAVAPFRPEIKR